MRIRGLAAGLICMIAMAGNATATSDASSLLDPAEAAALEVAEQRSSPAANLLAEAAERVLGMQELAMAHGGGIDPDTIRLMERVRVITLRGYPNDLHRRGELRASGAARAFSQGRTQADMRTVATALVELDAWIPSVIGQATFGLAQYGMPEPDARAAATGVVDREIRSISQGYRPLREASYADLAAIEGFLEGRETPDYKGSVRVLVDLMQLVRCHLSQPVSAPAERSMQRMAAL